MTLVSIGRRVPSVHESAWVAATATLVGSVVVEANASIWYGVVVRADRDVITIGEGSNIQDGCVLHTDPDLPLHLGRDVSVGHAAVLHGCTVGDGALVGMGAIVLNGARIGAECVIGAGALVPEGLVVPDGSLVLGVPGRVRRPLTETERGHGRRTATTYRDLAKEHRAAG